MAGKLADRIQAERSRQFVGRTEEMALFSFALSQDSMPFVVLSVYGPGGVGKTSLRRKLESICRDVEVPFVSLDGRYLQPNPDSFKAGLCQALGAESADSGMVVLADGGKAVLFVDTYEAIEPLDGWIRDTMVPNLPESSVLVVRMLGQETTDCRLALGCLEHPLPVAAPAQPQ